MIRRSYFKVKPKKVTLRKRKPKAPLKTAKEQLWQLCRSITFQRYGDTCYTCGAKHLTGSNRQTGHFIASSICSTALRYDLDNLRIQCAACNIWKSGNWVAFEEHLEKEMGKDHPTVLKRRNRDTIGRKFDILWYQNKIIEYTALLDKTGE